MVQKRVPLWEKTKREKRQSRLLRTVLWLLFLFLVVNLGIKAVGIFKSLSEPLSPYPGDSAKKTVLDLSFRTNILVFSYRPQQYLVDAAIVSFEPKDKIITSLQLDLPKNPNLSKIIQPVFKEGSVGALKKYLGVSLGVGLYRYVAIEEASDGAITHAKISSLKEKLANPVSLFSILFNQSALKSYFKTNITNAEGWSFFWRLRDAEYDESSSYLVKGYDLLSEDNASDLKNFFLDRKVVNEGSSISILNASGQPGLAQTFARYLENLGVSVVSLESSEKEEKASFILVNRDKPDTEKRLSQILDLGKKAEKDTSFVGDILVILGTDAIDKLTLDY